MKNRWKTLAVCLAGALVTNVSIAETPPRWQIEVEGQPVLNGGNVMPLNIGEIHKSNLLGANAIVNFSVTGQDSPQAYGAQVYYLDSGTRCDRGHGAAGGGELELAREDGRIIVSGRISCKPQEGDAEMRDISGWFEE